MCEISEDEEKRRRMGCGTLWREFGTARSRSVSGKQFEVKIGVFNQILAWLARKKRAILIRHEE
jgi:hypothetical protein